MEGLALQVGFGLSGARGTGLGVFPSGKESSEIDVQIHDNALVRHGCV